ncbi:MAG: flagellar biosynthetic protein FliR [Thiovulaceae bacterium]|nr:flagellar biosynthetic protein FliR [Sulfurimonadaceae bacterium]MCW9027135.1 flagellar biosynthetic protein FliR [Sulfurimonadaceae bacterium]
MSWAQVFTQDYVVGFILLFFRFAAMFMAAPIFSHQNIPQTIKAALAFVFTIVFYSSMPQLEISLNIVSVIIAILSEILFGLAIGVVLQVAYNVITFAGGQISFMMGFSMASAIDPQTGVSMPIISQFLSLLALMVLLSIDMHHWLLLFINDSLSQIPLGGFLMQENLFRYTIEASSKMFLVGFIIAFPIIALTFLQDVIFGMLMKTMPQFNLLVIGFPIKIAFAFIVLIAILTSTMLVFKGHVQEAFNYLEILF